MTGEDLTIQPGLALQQDLALVSILGLTHVERNGHHYVNGMAGLPAGEQENFLSTHADLYERSHGAVRVRIREGKLEIGSLDCAGYASCALPHWFHEEDGVTFKVLGTNHTSFTVSNLDRTVGFFRDCLGFELVSKAPRDPALVSRITESRAPTWSSRSLKRRDIRSSSSSTARRRGRAR